MSHAVLDPMTVLHQWSDHPMHNRVVQLLHPSLDDLDVAVGADDDDAVLCMATCLAMVRRRDLLVAAKDVDVWRRAMARVSAVADVCGRVAEAHISQGSWATTLRFIHCEVAQ